MKHIYLSVILKNPLFYKLDLEIAYKQGNLVFFWIEKGRSWLGLWETDKVKTPYHPSLRHIAFQIDRENMQSVKEWLEERGIDVSTNFGFPSEKQPLVLPNNPQAHAAIYFKDPDGNSIELIAPLRLDFEEEIKKMTLEEWNQTCQGDRPLGSL